MERSASSRAYEKLQVPKWPKYGDMKNWLTQLKRNVISCAPTTDRSEIAWLNEISGKTFEALADSGSPKMLRLDLCLSRLVANCIHKSGETLSEDVLLADRDASDKNDILRGRQMIWMMMSFFKTHGSLDTPMRT